MTLVGGLGTLFGPVAGAFCVIAMQNYLAPFGQWVLVIQGAIFVLCVLFVPPRHCGRIGSAFAHQTVSSNAVSIPSGQR